MANILDHNGPFAVSERRLQYYFENSGEEQVVDPDGTVAHSVNSADTGSAVQVSQGPPGSARAAAMGSLAVIESYSCVTGNYGLYYEETREIDCSDASYQAAAAQAVNDVFTGVDGIRGLYSHNETIVMYLDMALEKSLEKVPDGPPKTKGIDIGHKIGLIVLQDRLDDGWADEVSA